MLILSLIAEAVSEDIFLMEIQLHAINALIHVKYVLIIILVLYVRLDMKIQILLLTAEVVLLGIMQVEALFLVLDVH